MKGWGRLAVLIGDLHDDGHQFLEPHSLDRNCRDHGDTELPGESFCVNSNPLFLCNIHLVEGEDHAGL